MVISLLETGQISDDILCFCKNPMVKHQRDHDHLGGNTGNSQGLQEGEWDQGILLINGAVSGPAQSWVERRKRKTKSWSLLKLTVGALCLSLWPTYQGNKENGGFKLKGEKSVGLIKPQVNRSSNAERSTQLKVKLSQISVLRTWIFTVLFRTSEKMRNLSYFLPGPAWVFHSTI